MWTLRDKRLSAWINGQKGGKHAVMDKTYIIAQLIVFESMFKGIVLSQPLNNAPLP